MSQKDTSYVHIESTLCLRTTPRKYNTGGCKSGTDIAMYFMLFEFISYICGFRKYRKMIEHTKYQ